MKACSYCGKQYPDDMAVCPLDQQPLTAAAEVAPQVSPEVAPVVMLRGSVCPQCGEAEDFTHVMDFGGSFNLPAFLLGGLIGVMLRNAGKARAVCCNKCQTRFYLSTPFSKISRMMFWFLVTPTIILLILALIASLQNASSR